MATNDAGTKQTYTYEQRTRTPEENQGAPDELQLVVDAIAQLKAHQDALAAYVFNNEPAPDAILTAEIIAWP